MPGRGTLDDLTKALRQAEPANLTTFLSGFAHSSPALAGDVVAMERIGVEFCEDMANNGVLYVETRFCPCLWVVGEAGSGDSSATVDQVVEAVLRGLKKGEELYGKTIVDVFFYLCLMFIFCRRDCQVGDFYLSSPFPVPT